MKNKHFVVFLDVDGVLNSKTTVQKTPEGYRGIDDARVEILSKVIEKMGGGDLLVLAGWSIWLAPTTLLALLLVASSLGLLTFFSYQGIWKKQLAQLPFVPFLSLGLLIVRFLAFHTFDGFFL